MTPIQTLVKSNQVQQALDSFNSQLDQLIALAIDVQQIPAPTGDEAARAEFAKAYFKTIGLVDVQCDAISNVFGRLLGRMGGAPIVVTAHSDTVFSAETDLSVKRDGHYVHGPGIADNSTGVAGLLTLANTIQAYELQPQRDIWFVVNVGEEGLGDLRGMRAVTDRFSDAEAFIVVEGGMYGYLLHEAIGVQRFELSVTTEGGHSWSEFGRTNAIHVLGNLISQLDEIVLPSRPKTTLNIGVVEGGTSINTIASSARLQLDLRSEMPHGLSFLVRRVQQIVQAANETYQATVALREIGNRPAGRISRNTPPGPASRRCLTAVGCRQIHYLRGSTDANIPLSQGKNAVCIGLAHSSNAHRVDEVLDTTLLPQGMQQLLLLTLSASSY